MVAIASTDKKKHILLFLQHTPVADPLHVTVPGLNINDLILPVYNIARASSGQKIIDFNLLAGALVLVCVQVHSNLRSLIDRYINMLVDR